MSAAEECARCAVRELCREGKIEPNITTDEDGHSYCDCYQ